MTLPELYIELDAVEIALTQCFFREDRINLERYYAELLGEIKQLEKDT